MISSPGKRVLTHGNYAVRDSVLDSFYLEITLTLLGSSYTFCLKESKVFTANGWARGESDKKEKSVKPYHCFFVLGSVALHGVSFSLD